MADNGASTQTEVLIVGGGPTGLFAACDLSRRGISCRIIEKAEQFFVGTRGKGIHPRSQELLDDLGLIDRFEPYAEPQPPMWLYIGSKPAGTLRFDGGVADDTPYQAMILCPQYQTEQIFRDRLAEHGVSVELGKELIGFAETASGVTAKVRTSSGGTEEITAQYLIGADGGHSATRKLLGIEFEGVSHPEMRYLIGDIEIEGLDHGYRYAFMNPENNRFLQATPIKNSRLWQFGGDVDADANGNIPEPSAETFQKLFDDVVGMPGVKMHSPTWLSKFIFTSRMVGRYGSGRVFLAGDAAHVHSPVTGEGLNAGLQDAYNLCWKLALVIRGAASSSLLDTYTEERVPPAKKVLETATDGHMALFSNTFFMSLLRKFVILPLLKRPRFGRKVMRRTSGLDWTYRDRTLTVDSLGSKGKVLAGDRMPDGPLRTPGTSSHRRLFDLLRGPQFTVLAFGDIPSDRLVPLRRSFGEYLRIVSITAGRGDPEPPEGVEVACDPGGRTARILGVRRPTLFLVRPDGYVGFRGTGELGPVEAYLDTILDRRSDAEHLGFQGFAQTTVSTASR